MAAEGLGTLGVAALAQDTLQCWWAFGSPAGSENWEIVTLVDVFSREGFPEKPRV